MLLIMYIAKPLHCHSSQCYHCLLKDLNNIFESYKRQKLYVFSNGKIFKKLTDRRPKQTGKKWTVNYFFIASTILAIFFNVGCASTILATFVLPNPSYLTRQMAAKKALLHTFSFSSLDWLTFDSLYAIFEQRRIVWALKM